MYSKAIEVAITKMVFEPYRAASHRHELPSTGGREPAELTLRLVKDQPIRGRVVNTEGRPVPGARVAVDGLFASAEERLDDFLTAWKREWQLAPQRMSKRACGSPITQCVARPRVVTDQGRWSAPRTTSPTCTRPHTAPAGSASLLTRGGSVRRTSVLRRAADIDSELEQLRVGIAQLRLRRGDIL